MLLCFLPESLFCLRFRFFCKKAKHQSPEGTYFESNYFDFSVTLADDDSVYSVDGFDGIPGIGDEVTISAVYFTGAAAQAGDSRIYGGIHLKDGDLQGQIIGYITGSQVLQKIDSLEQGLSLEEVSSLPIQSFGTMKNDTLLEPLIC